MLKSIDPATGRELASFPEADEAAIESALTRAWRSRHPWRDAGPGMRASLMRSVAGVLRTDKSRYAALLTTEMGKPIVEAEAEIEKCAWTANWLAENGERLLADEPTESTATESYVRVQPLGVILAVMPWNFPFWQAFRAGLPALIAGRARYQDNGQSCIATKCFIVEEAVADELERRITAAVAALKVGNPMDRANQVGPLARGDLVEERERQVNESVRLGARALTGGKRIGGDGYYFEPTVLANVRPGMPAYHEETFGPVAAVIRVKDAEDALRVANDTDFGLGSNIWTRDIERAKKLAERIEAGLVFINGMVASDARLPFGGVKGSGYGRALSSYGIKEFTNIQTVWVGPGRPAGQAAKALPRAE